MIRSEEIARVSRYLKQKDLYYRIVIEDLQKAIDEENPSLSEQEVEELQGRKGLHQPIQFHWSSQFHHRFPFLAWYFFFFLFIYPKIIAIYLAAIATLLRPISLIKITIKRNDVSLVILFVPLTRMTTFDDRSLKEIIVYSSHAAKKAARTSFIHSHRYIRKWFR